MPHAATVELEIGERVEFTVEFRAVLSQRTRGQLKMTVVNNQFEDTIIQLVHIQITFSLIKFVVVRYAINSKQFILVRTFIGR